MPALLAFLGGALYEAAAVRWAVHATAGRAARAALASAVCGACLLAGVGESLRGGPWVGAAFVAGYALGTYAAVRWRRA